MEKLSARKCKICDRPLKPEETCSNPICLWEDYRQFLWNYACAMRSGHLENAINSYKYHDKKEWAQIFARVLVGFLDEHRKTFNQFDLIIPSPTYISRDDGRHWDHTGRVIDHAYTCSYGRMPFDMGSPRAIVKTRATPKMVGKKWSERKENAETELRSALHVPDSKRTSGKAILVYDDVFTDGFTLNEVARCLRRDGGAKAVCGVTLARQQWRSH
jgi:predicted amidophosphoribosyltransferase